MSNFANPELDNYFRRIILPSGTAAAPSIVFANDQTQGFYYDVDAGLIKAVGFDGGGGGGGATTALDNLAAVAINTDLLPSIDNTINLGNGGHQFANLSLGGNATINGSIFNADGATNAPSYSFDSDTTTGVFLSAPGFMDIVTSNTLIARFTSTLVSVNGDIVPFADGGSNLGKQTNRWGNVILNTNGAVYFNNGIDFNDHIGKTGSQYLFTLANKDIVAMDTNGISLQDNEVVQASAGTVGLFLGGATTPTLAVELFSIAGELHFNDTNGSALFSATNGSVNAVINLGSNSADGTVAGTIMLQSIGPAVVIPGDSHPNNCAQFDHSITANETRMLLYDVNSGALQRVTVGVADSGGTGFRVLRIPN